MKLSDWLATPIGNLQLELEMTKTGYSSPEDDSTSEDSGDYHYSVSRQTIGHDPRPVAVVMRDGASFAYIPCDSEEEYEWIRERLTGSRRSV